MAVPSRFILHQGPTLGALARVALARGGGGGATPQTPGPEIVRTLPPRPAELVRAYIRHVGGEPSAYKGRVPPHLFPQWVFAMQAETLGPVPYPMQRVLNGGCRFEVRGSLPIDEPLQVRAWLESVDDDGRRVILRSRSITGTASSPDALVTDNYAIVPLAKGDGKSKKERPRVPADAREIAFLRIRRDAGLEFAKLTGDFNPIHWVGPYARAAGFRSVILHGFATMARAIEALNRGVFAGDPHRLTAFDCRFTRPLPLPAKVGVYVREREVFVGDAPGGPAYLTGSFEVRS